MGRFTGISRSYARKEINYRLTAVAIASSDRGLLQVSSVFHRRRYHRYPELSLTRRSAKRENWPKLGFKRLIYRCFAECLEGRRESVFIQLLLFVWDAGHSESVFRLSSAHMRQVDGDKPNHKVARRHDQKNVNTGSPAGLGPDGEPILKPSRLESGRNPARKPEIRPGSQLSDPEPELSC
jgi:hypothetical protein